MENFIYFYILGIIITTNHITMLADNNRFQGQSHFGILGILTIMFWPLLYIYILITLPFSN